MQEKQGKEKSPKHGGKRAGAGRKMSIEKKAMLEASAAAAARAASSGEMPLEYMLRVMRDETAEEKRRDQMAMGAAAYLHPRLQTTEHKGEITQNVVSSSPEPRPEEWAATHADNGAAH